MIARIGSSSRSSNPLCASRAPAPFRLPPPAPGVAHPEQRPATPCGSRRSRCADPSPARRLRGSRLHPGNRADEFMRDAATCRGRDRPPRTIVWPSPSLASCQALFSICNCISRPMKGDNCVSARNCQRERPRLISVTSIELLILRVTRHQRRRQRLHADKPPADARVLAVATTRSRRRAWLSACGPRTPGRRARPRPGSGCAGPTMTIACVQRNAKPGYGTSVAERQFAQPERGPAGERGMPFERLGRAEGRDDFASRKSSASSRRSRARARQPS